MHHPDPSGGQAASPGFQFALCRAVRFPGRGNAAVLGPLASQDPGKVHHSAAILRCDSTVAAAIANSNTGQAMLV